MNSPSDDAAQAGQEEVRWTARKLRPSILVYVLLVFGSVMAISQFVLHSTSALRSLALAAVASIVALLPQVLGRIEYNADAAGVGKRSSGKNGKGAFERVFLWSELTHAIVMKHGFRYFKDLDERNPVRRFIKRQFSDRYSGEIHVEAGDQGRVYGLLADRGIPLRHR